MDRRALALVSAVVLLVAVGARWLSTIEVPLVSLPEPAAPPAAPVQPQVATQGVAPVVPAAAAMIALPSADAGPLVMAEVQIELLRDGKHLAGTRVELQGPGGRVARSTDVMGFAHFAVQEGAWRVTDPPRRGLRLPRLSRATRLDRAAREALLQEHWLATTTPLEVRAPLTRLRIDLPRIHRISGRVTDPSGAPIFDAEVTCSRPDFEPDMPVTRSGVDGSFSIETDGEPQWLQARTGEHARSVARLVKGTEAIELVIQPWTHLHVEVIGPGTGMAAVRALHNGVLVAEGSSEEPLWVPVGQLDLLARRAFRGWYLSGKASVTTMSSQKNEARIVLKPSPPLRGRLVDLGGMPVKGITIEAHELELESGSPRPDGGLPWREVEGTSTTTNFRGEFRLTPVLGCCSDPVYQLEVVGLWRSSRSVLMRIDDAPIEIEVIPAQE